MEYQELEAERMQQVANKNAETLQSAWCILFTFMGFVAGVMFCITITNWR